MRASAGFRVVSLAAILIGVAIWLDGRATAAALRDRSAALHNREQQLSRLRVERDRLRGQLHTLAGRRLDHVRPAATGNHDPRIPENAASTGAFSVGQWTPVTAWKNEGRSTPLATVSTLLWAAVGGDLAAVQSILQFDDAARHAARAWFEALPPATRSLYAAPEDLVASVTMSRISPTNAELSWFHEIDANHAIIGMMLARPASAGSEPISTIQPAVANDPPVFANHDANQLAVLDLVRSADGWKVVVPVAAIKRMAKVLSVTTGH